ncbi:MAG: hypothetical protein O7C75_02895 [Verrucomicrobia bacterium]|nr:hypothetical protein [Verrucomicrobiota bacterium]
MTDCSTLGVRVGVLGDGGWLAYRNHSGEVALALFEAVKEVLSQASLSLGQLAGFIFCEGPGSTLGIRINAMALRTWNSLGNKPRPVFAYKSLEAAAILVRLSEANDSAFTLFSDLRKNAWNACSGNSDGSTSTIEVVPKESLGNWKERRYFIQQRLYSPGAPPESEPLNYDLEPLGASDDFINLFQPVEQPAVYQTTTTQFKKWVPQRHR